MSTARPYLLKVPQSPSIEGVALGQRGGNAKQRALAANPADQSLIPEATWYKKRTDFCRLTVGLYLYAVARTRPTSPIDIDINTCTTFIE